MSGSSTYVSEDTICTIHATTHSKILLTEWFETEPASQVTQAHSSRNRFCQFFLNTIGSTGTEYAEKDSLGLISLLLDHLNDSIYWEEGSHLSQEAPV